MTGFDRRAFLRSTGLVGAGLVLAGCGGDDQPSGSTGGTNSTGQLSGTARFTTWAGDQEAVVFKKLAADFKAARGAEVTVEVLPYDQIRTVVDRRLQANDPPDLFRVSYTDMAGYASNGALADLSDAFDEEFRGQFFPGLWSAMQVDGAPFGVPHHTDTSALVFNKTHMEKAGITEVPTTLETAWTWEELAEVLQKLKAANPNAAPFAFNYQAFGAFRFYNTVFQAGGTVLDEGLTAPTIDTPEVRKALEWVKSLYTEGLHEKSVLVKRPTYPDEIFPTQKISMIQTGSFLVPSLDDTVKDKFEWGATYLPRDVGAAADLGGNGVVVTDGAKNPEVAVEFAKFLVTKENMQLFCEQTGALPVRNDLADAKLGFTSRPDLMPIFQQQATTQPEKLVQTCVLPAFPGINQALIDNMDPYLSNPGASTDSVVAGLTASIQKALQV